MRIEGEVVVTTRRVIVLVPELTEDENENETKYDDDDDPCPTSTTMNPRTS